MAGLKRRHAIILAALTLQACSVNEYGTSTVERIAADGAHVFSVSGWGIHLNTRGDPLSLTVGKYSAQHIFPDNCPGIDNVADLSSTELFQKLLPQFSLTQSAGISVDVGSNNIGITIGVRENGLLLSVDNAASIQRQLRYSVNHPGATYLRVDGDGTCGG